jgi:probable rRNA maturation factor
MRSTSARESTYSITCSKASVSDTAGAEPFLLINRQRKHKINRDDLEDFLDRFIAYNHLGAQFSVVLVSDRTIHRYNRQYRGRDKATDVLSFPGDEGYLGDILISVETASEQARRSKALTLEKNIRRLALHGLLHLMGYDHETDRGEMRALEFRLRRRFEC